MMRSKCINKTSNSTGSLKLNVKFTIKFLLTDFKYYYHKCY